VADKSRVLDTSRYPRGTFGHIAFVSVVSGTVIRSKIPVPVLDGRIVTIPVSEVNEEEAEAREAFAELFEGAQAACQVQALMFADINRLVADPKKRAEAIERVKATLKRCQDDHGRLGRKRDAERGKLAKLPKRMVAQLDALLRQVKAGEEDLKKTVGDLEEIEREERSPERKEWLLKEKQAEALVRQAELGQALAIYEAAPEKFKDGLKKRIAELKKLWEPRGPTHAEARKFLYEMWPTLETAQMKEGLVKAEDALKVCDDKKDIYGPIKFRNASLKHTERLLAEAKDLRPGVNPGHTEAADRIKEVSAKLQDLVQRAEKIIERHK
jgi:hypothetical protein